ncbi:hypothetical protein [Paenibacillus oleatilyticus]|uniref:hypothetical protein n=1 Tax=Paenibacillus oleatilyticus TaxID=2594886 RepID=UPI001C1FD0E8|nr:hypothetical protein [Paenibacillus oleatilyticus]MBU7320546.1 hypothetical protein [Paenibacillus oleatilyticus]
MTTTIVVFLIIIIIISSIFGGSNKRRYRQTGYSRNYGRYNEMKEQREQERALRYLERQQKSSQGYLKGNGAIFKSQSQKSQFTQSYKRRFK